MELALQQSKEVVELANRTKTEFLTNMSHELRAPLNSIIRFSDVLQMAALGPVSPKYREYASEINLAGRHLLALISDILGVSKIEAGEIAIDEEVFDLSGLIAETLRMVRDWAEQKGVELNESSLVRKFLIRADLLRLKQVLLNVLSNAIKFTPEGGKLTCQRDARTAVEISLFRCKIRELGSVRLIYRVSCNRSFKCPTRASAMRKERASALL